jgi:diaminopimelate decarboxylase
MKKKIIKNDIIPPFFIYDYKIIKRQFIDLRNKLPKNLKIYFSVKANPNSEILKIYKKIGAFCEVSSVGEIKKVLKAGFAPCSILYTGVGKTEDDLKFSISRKVGLIVAESENEIKLIQQITDKKKVNQNILIRLQPRKSIKKSAKFSMSEGIQKFGIGEENIEASAQSAEGSKYISLLGFHLFSGSNIYKYEHILKNTEYFFNFVKKMELKFSHSFPVIDIGGGLPVNYSIKKNIKFNLIEFVANLKKMIFKYGFVDKSIILETGRYLVAEAGCYYAQVVDIKKSAQKKIVIINGGMTHLCRSALFEEYHDVEIVEKKKSEKIEDVIIMGNLNAGIDIVTKARLPKLAIGDLLKINKTGAYGLTAGMLMFSSHKLPGEYLLNRHGNIIKI